VSFYSPSKSSKPDYSNKIENRCLRLLLHSLHQPPSKRKERSIFLVNVQIVKGCYSATSTPPLKSMERNSPHHSPQRPRCIHIFLHSILYPSISYSSSHTSNSFVQVRYSGQCLSGDVCSSLSWLYINARLGHQSPV